MRSLVSAVNESYSPRTVVVVALLSLVAGFVLVFGSGTLALRGRAPQMVSGETETDPVPPPRPVATGSDDAGATTEPSTPTPSPTPGPSAGGGGGDAAAPVAGGRTVTISPSGVSRCWDQGNVAVLTAASCDRLPGLDQHLAAHATELGNCARGHGRLSFIVDLRFSTSNVRSWGGPTSSVPNAGDVVACVRRVTQPLPLATLAHAHDRYIVVVPMEW